MLKDKSEGGTCQRNYNRREDTIISVPEAAVFLCV